LDALVSETTNILNLGHPSIVEKDFHLTRAIHVMSDFNNDYFTLVFQGGTALAKAHRIVERMSEDCDFRIHLTEAGKNLSLNQRRNKLRELREKLISDFSHLGFSTPNESIKVRDAGNYFQFALLYPSLYENDSVLRPHIQLEFMVVNSKLQVLPLLITTLIQETLGNVAAHPSKMLECVAVSETAAEKWVALTRRVANSMKNPNAFSDPTLVRHIYDLYCIKTKCSISEEVYPLIGNLIMEDISRYKNQNTDYVENPKKAIMNALLTLKDNSAWEKNWNDFMQAMVYSEHKPDYDIALKNLNQISQKIFFFLT
jgi:predicted nucleotidyltransferase component of viral defense system